MEKQSFYPCTKRAILEALFKGKNEGNNLLPFENHFQNEWTVPINHKTSKSRQPAYLSSSEEESRSFKAFFHSIAENTPNVILIKPTRQLRFARFHKRVSVGSILRFRSRQGVGAIHESLLQNV